MLTMSVFEILAVLTTATAVFSWIHYRYLDPRAGALDGARSRLAPAAPRRDGRMIRRALAAMAVTASLPVSAAAQGPCTGAPGFGELDFWVGTWAVEVSGQRVGTNRIEKILGGCAVAEHWTDASVRRGYSLFYYIPALGEWRQVWVTEYATGVGGVKEKRLVARLPDGGLRFQGEIPVAGGDSYLDRTTLTPLDDRRVRQVIEVSRDGGATWRVTFDAMYRAEPPED